MRDKFYFLFIDEIYTPNLNEFLHIQKKDIFERKKHHHFGLVGVIIPANQLVRTNFRCRRIQRRFYPSAKSPIFHYVDILHERELYSDLRINSEKRRKFVSSLQAWVMNSEFQALFAFIDKEELIKKYGFFNKAGLLKGIRKIRGNIFPRKEAKDYNLYSLSLKFMLLKFYQFLSRKRGRGVLVSESRGGVEDSNLRDIFDLVQRQGISNVGVREFRGIVVEFFVINKKLNQAGLQLADLILYPTYDAEVPMHSVRRDHFIKFPSHISRKLYKGKDAIHLFP